MQCPQKLDILCYKNRNPSSPPQEYRLPAPPILPVYCIGNAPLGLVAGQTSFAESLKIFQKNFALRGPGSSVLAAAEKPARPIPPSSPSPFVSPVALSHFVKRREPAAPDVTFPAWRFPTRFPAGNTIAHPKGPPTASIPPRRGCARACCPKSPATGATALMILANPHRNRGNRPFPKTIYHTH